MCTVSNSNTPHKSARTSTALVIGASGAVGSRLVPLLHELGFSVITAGRNRARNDIALDLLSPLQPSTSSLLAPSPSSQSSSYRAATERADVVINCSGIENPELASLSAAPFIDISASAGYFAAVAAVSPPSGALLSVGLAPGISSLLLAALDSEAGDGIDLGVVLGVGEKHGDAAISWTAALLGQRFNSPADGRAVLNFSEPQRFEVPGLGRAVLARAAFPDGLNALELTNSGYDGTTPVARVRSYFATTSALANLSLRAATRSARLGRKVVSLHLPGSDAWFVFARNRRTGAQLASRGRNQSLATAAVTALAAQVAVRERWSGVRHLPEMLSLNQLRQGLRGFELPHGVSAI